MKKINKINCETSSDHISICISPDKNNYINDIIKTINKNKKNSSKSDYFTLNIVECESEIYITIYLRNIDKEGELYYVD